MNQSNRPDAFHRLLKISSRQVVLLNALGDFRNMRRAALSMHTTQPAASLLLQQLEERLAVTLFDRLPRGMEPTIYGEVMIRYAKSVIHDFEHAEAEIAELAKGASGFVRIGSVMGPVPVLLTRGLLAFKAENPRVRVALDVGTSDNLLPSLVCGDIDLVLGRLPDELDNQAFSVHFFNRGEQMSVIARPGHPLAGKAKITLSDLLDLTWILHPIGSPMRSRVENALRSRKISSKLDIVETASILATTSMVEASDMISVVPYDVALHYANHGMVSILPVKLPISMINLGIVTNKAKPLAPAVLKLIEHIKKYEADNY